MRNARSLTRGFCLTMNESDDGPIARDAFVARYGGVYEHSPWIAEQVFDEQVLADLIDSESTEELTILFGECVDNAARDQRLALIRAHPDLAGRAAIAGELTADSNDEQSSAGIDQCTPEEFARFQDLNDHYRQKFSFPFVMAVRNSNRQAILSAFEERLKNSATDEFEYAVAEIHKIAAMRLAALENA